MRRGRAPLLCTAGRRGRGGWRRCARSRGSGRRFELGLQQKLLGGLVDVALARLQGAKGVSAARWGLDARGRGRC
eukprot:scaffold22156_cov148-Isochrysis_galbana.AAC.1